MMANQPREPAGFQPQPLWEGPSTLITIRTSKAKAMKSLLKSSYREPTGMGKQAREGTVRLDRLGFDADEHVFAVHGGPEQAVLQYNAGHYTEWKQLFKEIKVADDEKRDKLLDLGGFGENIATENVDGEIPMDERTMCVGDLVGICRPNSGAGASGMGRPQARMRVTGPRLPCFKLNHRFGVPNMSQRAQDRFWTGWMYSIDTEGDVQVGDIMVLLERPFPQWPVARIQHHLFKDTQNLEMLRKALDTLGSHLVAGCRSLFEQRFTKGTEDMSTRLQGADPVDTFVEYCLREKIRQTERVLEFVLERVEKLPEDSSDFEVAKSGSHIRLRMKPDSSRIVRPYSVVYGDTNSFRLGVALADQSRGASSFLHRSLNVGDTIECSTKFANTFALEEEKATKHVFLAGGIGITAFLDHMLHCMRIKQKFHLHYMIRNKSYYAFRELINSIINSTTTGFTLDSQVLGSASSRTTTYDLISADNSARVTVYVSSEGRRCDLKTLLSDLAEETSTHIYVCGSEKMGDTIRETATSLSIADSRMHYEEFSIDATGDPFVAELTKSKKRVEVGPRQTLLEALREVGLDIPSSCEAGSCGTCQVRVKCGRVQHKGTGLPDEDKVGYGGNESGEMLSCVSRGLGTIEIEI